jgi:multisubunit Na+/H+ antiporter MnhF subunit
MTFWLGAALVLIVGAVAPAAYRGSRGGGLDRLIGLQLVSAAMVPVLLLLSVGFGQSSYLIVPLVLAVLSYAGALVFVRLTGARS